MSMRPFPTQPSVASPVHEKRPVEITQHGSSRRDDYAWLRAENWRDVLRDPSMLHRDIRAALEAENEYYAALTADIAPLREKLLQEMRARIKEDDESVPFADGPWRYWRRHREGGEYPIFMRAPREGGSGKALFDGDKESEGSEFFSVSAFHHSPDHRFATYAIDRVGSEYYMIGVRDLDTGQDLPDRVGSADACGGVWDANSKGFFYVERDDNQRPVRVRYHALGAKPLSDRLIYEEEDKGFFLDISKSLDGRFIFINLGSQTTTETWFLSSDDPSEEPRLIAARETGVEYYAEHRDDVFIILTNADGAVDFKISSTPVAAPERANWVDVTPHEPGRTIVDLIVYRDQLVRLERRDARPRIVITDRKGNESEIAFDEPAYSVGVEAGYEFDAGSLRFAYQSPSTPKQTFDFNFDNGERTVLKTQEVPSGHDPSRYAVERIDAEAPDGALVPVVILRLRTTPIDGTAPALLYGYGAYGATIPDSFSTSVLSLVERGVVYALAHVRGGAARGRQWYLDGKLNKKMNSFTDFIAAAEALADQRYAAKNRIVSYGGSAGGLLVAAAVNLRPDLFAGVLAAVPFVDVLSTISDVELPLTPPEWEEWGNPIETAAQFEWIRRYSPYDNISVADYPPVMATAGLTDYRVTYWEPAKWIARLRDRAGGGPFALRINMEAGHAGSAARFERLEETAHLYAFALKTLGEEDAQPGEG